jgi:Leucine-rich repeat (LRR) protein
VTLFIYYLHLLDLANNNFGGHIPPSLFKLSNLQYLFLAHNNFNRGSIPSMLGEQLPALIDLSFRSTNRIGSIPSSMGKLSNLLLLDLHQNFLNGTLPESLGHLTQLQYLILNDNYLSSTIPLSFRNLTHLDTVLINANSFTGNVNNTLCLPGRNYSTMTADCQQDVTDGSFEVRCPCCTQCCAPHATRAIPCVVGTANTADGDYYADQDPLWLYNYTRRNFLFNGGQPIFEEHGEVNSTHWIPTNDTGSTGNRYKWKT